MTAENKNTSKLASDRDKLVADLKTLIDDAKVLTSDASGASREFAAEKAETLRGQLKEAMEKLKAETESACTKTRDTIDNVEKLIKDNPWQSVGIALIVGIAIDRLFRD